MRATDVVQVKIVANFVFGCAMDAFEGFGWFREGDMSKFEDSQRKHGFIRGIRSVGVFWAAVKTGFINLLTLSVWLIWRANMCVYPAVEWRKFVKFIKQNHTLWLIGIQWCVGGLWGVWVVSASELVNSGKHSNSSVSSADWLNFCENIVRNHAKLCWWANEEAHSARNAGIY